LLRSQEERENLRIEARQEAEKWGWEAATEQLCAYYRQVIYGNTQAKAA
jgi:hypothetical protein